MLTAKLKSYLCLFRTNKNWRHKWRHLRKIHDLWTKPWIWILAIFWPLKSVSAIEGYFETCIISVNGCAIYKYSMVSLGHPVAPWSVFQVWSKIRNFCIFSKIAPGRHQVTQSDLTIFIYCEFTDKNNAGLKIIPGGTDHFLWPKNSRFSIFDLSP